MVDGLVELGLGSRSPEDDEAPQVLVSPMLSEEFRELSDRLLLLRFKKLPPKFGFVMDNYGQPACLQYSGDIRIYVKPDDVLIALDNAGAGVNVSYSQIEGQIRNMIDWYMSNRLDEFSRVSSVVSTVGCPSSFASSPLPQEKQFKKIGFVEGGVFFALNSGQFHA